MKISKQLLIVIMVMILAILACSSESDVSVRPVEDTQQQEEAAEEEAVPEAPPVGTARSNPAPVGTEVSTDNMAFVIMGAERPGYDYVKAGNMFNTEPSEGKEYLFVEYRITCEKSSDDTCRISRFNFKLLGEAGISYDPETVSGLDGMLERTEFYGEAVVTGRLAYIVEEAENLLFVYDPLFGQTIYMQVP